MAAGAASVSEPGVPIGGAVYYQPSPQRPQMEGTTYYAPPTSTSENSGTTFYPQQQPPPHHFSPTPTAENQGPVYYDTKSQVAKSSPQSRPRVKNVIPIVAPEVSSPVLSCREFYRDQCGCGIVFASHMELSLQCQSLGG